jgi:hypothetical protein
MIGFPEIFFVNDSVRPNHEGLNAGHAILGRCSGQGEADTLKTFQKMEKYNPDKRWNSTDDDWPEGKE